MRVLFALIVCSHAAASAAAGIQLNDLAGPPDSTRSATLTVGETAPMAHTLDFASPLHMTIGRDATGPALDRSKAAGPATRVLHVPSMLHSFDIAVFNDAESQPTAPVEFTTASAIPAPASMLLIVLGGLIALRR